MIKKVAFIGVGYMGYGVAKNLILKNFNLKVIAHKNKKPIDKLKKIGAIEVDNYDDLLKDIDLIEAEHLSVFRSLQVRDWKPPEFPGEKRKIDLSLPLPKSGQYRQI